MIVSLVLAVSENGVIGKGNRLPWHLPADLRFFRNLTTGHTVIMGRKTFESIGRPLPNRRNIVVTRNRGLELDGVAVMHSLGEALKACVGEAEVFIIGGSAVYEKALELDVVNKIYLTRVHAQFEGDTHFELTFEKGWVTAAREHHDADEKNKYPYSFITLVRERTAPLKKAFVS